jgi:hypothetical protein
VAVLHESVGASLILPESWDQRPPRRVRDDEDMQRALIAHLRRDGYGSQADRVEQDVGCARVRSEEVAGSSGLPHRPADFVVAEQAGRDVLAQLAAL